MASSYSRQIPCIIGFVQKIKTKSVLYIGKGFGKYGFSIHEYIEIDNGKQSHPERTMSEQSMIKIDAIKVDNIFYCLIFSIFIKIYLWEMFLIFIM